MTPETLREIEERANAATPGPWELSEPSHTGKRSIGTGTFSAFFDSYAHDAEFCAHARTDIPALISEVRRLTAEWSKERDVRKPYTHKALLESKAYCHELIEAQREEIERLTGLLSKAEECLDTYYSRKSSNWYDDLVGGEGVRFHDGGDDVRGYDHADEALAEIRKGREGKE